MAVEVQFYRSIWRGKSSQIRITAFFAICKASIVPVIMECMKRLSTFFTLTPNFYIGSPLHFLFCRQRRIRHPASRHISATAVLQPEPQPENGKDPAAIIREVATTGSRSPKKSLPIPPNSTTIASIITLVPHSPPSTIKNHPMIDRRIRAHFSLNSIALPPSITRMKYSIAHRKMPEAFHLWHKYHPAASSIFSMKMP